MIVAVVQFAVATPFTQDGARTAFEASAPSYTSIPGLRHKHFLVSADGATAGGVYEWDSQADAEAWFTPAWSERLAAKFGSAPDVRYFEVPVSVDGPSPRD